MLVNSLITFAAGIALTLIVSIHPRGRALIGRLARVGLALWNDRRIPFVVRLALGACVVLDFGIVDELIGALIVALIWPFYGHIIREAWTGSAPAVAAA